MWKNSQFSKTWKKTICVVQLLATGLITQAQLATNPEGLTFRNITDTGIGENPSVMQGYDRQRKVKNVTFENVIINGKQMKNLDGWITNEFIENITVK